MKTIIKFLLIGYGITAVYFLYLAAINLFVYFANTSKGFYEPFLPAGRNLGLGLVFTVIAGLSWFLIRQPAYHKAGNFIALLPLIAIGLFVCWFLIVMISSGGKWN
ncbi:MAG: hypothetical protein V9E90_12270 [Saprospiraceae bacterium]|jgi:hypothetical protein